MIAENLHLTVDTSIGLKAKASKISHGHSRSSSSDSRHQPISPALLAEKLESVEQQQQQDKLLDEPTTTIVSSLQVRRKSEEIDIVQVLQDQGDQGLLSLEAVEIVRTHHTHRLNPDLLGGSGSLRQSHGQSNLRHN